MYASTGYGQISLELTPAQLIQLSVQLSGEFPWQLKDVNI
jgi:hypothetical protein